MTETEDYVLFCLFHFLPPPTCLCGHLHVLQLFLLFLMWIIHSFICKCRQLLLAVNQLDANVPLIEAVTAASVTCYLIMLKSYITINTVVGNYIHFLQQLYILLYLYCL